MPINVLWKDQNKKVLRYILQGTWTWDDAKAAGEEVQRLLDSVTYKVDALVEFQDSGLLPGNVFQGSLGEAKTTPILTHPNVNHVFLIKAPLLMRTAASAVTSINVKAAERLRFVGSPEEAYAVIAAG